MSCTWQIHGHLWLGSYAHGFPSLLQTAEMPGFYKEGEYDVAGFAVGSVKKDRVIDGRDIKQGDVLLGLLSSGVHSNGFSLARRVLEVPAALFSHKSASAIVADNHSF